MINDFPLIFTNYNILEKYIFDSIAWQELNKAEVPVVSLSNASFYAYPCTNVFGLLIFEKAIIHIERLEKSWVLRFSDFMRADTCYNFIEKNSKWLASEGTKYLKDHSFAYCNGHLSNYFNAKNCVNFLCEVFNQKDLNMAVKELKKLKNEDTEWGNYKPYHIDNITEILLEPKKEMHKRFTNRYLGKPRLFFNGVEVTW